MPTSVSIHGAGKRRFEAVSPQRETDPEDEAAVNEVASAAVVEPTVDHADVSRPLLYVKAN